MIQNNLNQDNNNCMDISQYNRSNNGNIHNHNINNFNNNNNQPLPPLPPSLQVPIDTPSFQGKFGWEKIADDYGVPVILRTDGSRYSPVRIVEQEIIKRYETVPQRVFKFIGFKSYFLTASEAKILNIINQNHCDGRYGDLFFSTRDIVISAHDVLEMSRFLEISRTVYCGDIASLSHRLGLVDVVLVPSNPRNKICVPYLCKYISGQDQLSRFVPADFVDDYVINVTHKSSPSEFDLLCLKMLCLYCNSPRLSFIGPSSYIIPLDNLLYKDTNTPIIYEERPPPPKR